MPWHEGILYSNFAQVVLSHNERVNFLIVFINPSCYITDVVESIRVLWIV